MWPDLAKIRPFGKKSVFGSSYDGGFSIGQNIEYP